MNWKKAAYMAGWDENRRIKFCSDARCMNLEHVILLADNQLWHSTLNFSFTFVSSPICRIFCDFWGDINKTRDGMFTLPQICPRVVCSPKINGQWKGKSCVFSNKVFFLIFYSLNRKSVEISR